MNILTNKKVLFLLITLLIFCGCSKSNTDCSFKLRELAGEYETVMNEYIKARFNHFGIALSRIVSIELMNNNPRYEHLGLILIDFLNYREIKAIDIKVARTVNNYDPFLCVFIKDNKSTYKAKSEANVPDEIIRSTSQNTFKYFLSGSSIDKKTEVKIIFYYSSADIYEKFDSIRKRFSVVSGKLQNQR
mgnify:CR=1 FL=1